MLSGGAECPLGRKTSMAAIPNCRMQQWGAIAFPVVQLPPLALCTHAVSQPTRTQSWCHQANTFFWSHSAPGFVLFHPFLHFSFPIHSPLKQARLLVGPFFDSAKKEEKNAPQQVVWVGRENPLSWPWLWFGFPAA